MELNLLDLAISNSETPNLIGSKVKDIQIHNGLVTICFKKPKWKNTYCLTIEIQ